MESVKWLIWVIAFLMGAVCMSASLSIKEPSDSLGTVSAVDLSRYMGQWYEIAKIPNRFQRKCARNTTATYVLRADGNVDVINRCVAEDGDEVVSRGLAKVVDRQTRAKLKVSFVRLLGVRMFWGKYWIIGLDPDYQWALVGEPKRKYGWILARNSRLTPEQKESAFDRLRANGYDPDRFVESLHSGTQ